MKENPRPSTQLATCDPSPRACFSCSVLSVRPSQSLCLASRTCDGSPERSGWTAQAQETSNPPLHDSVHATEMVYDYDYGYGMAWYAPAWPCSGSRPPILSRCPEVESTTREVRRRDERSPCTPHPHGQERAVGCAGHRFKRVTNWAYSASHLVFLGLGQTFGGSLGGICEPRDGRGQPASEGSKRASCLLSVPRWRQEQERDARERGRVEAGGPTLALVPVWRLNRARRGNGAPRRETDGGRRISY